MAASSSGLQDGYSQKQWGEWKSHGLLLSQAIVELSWHSAQEALMRAFKRFARTTDGFLTREEFQDLLRTYPESCHHDLYAIFFELFDRNQDQLLNELDFLGGILAVSPKTPHKIDAASGQLRLQFIFLYYDQNRNGKFEVEELAKLLEHLYQLRGNSGDAAADSQQLLSVYPGSFGFKSFRDAAQKRLLSGTSQLLRMQSDLSDILLAEEAGEVPQVQIIGVMPGQVNQVPRKAQNTHGDPPAVIHGKPSVIDPSGPFLYHACRWPSCQPSSAYFEQHDPAVMMYKPTFILCVPNPACLL